MDPGRKNDKTRLPNIQACALSVQDLSTLVELWLAVTPQIRIVQGLELYLCAA